MTPKTDDMSGSRRIFSLIALLSGLWLFVSPWVFNADSFGNAYSGRIVGALIAILAGFELSTPSMRELLSWISCLLAIWIFASPWMFGYTNSSGRFVNSLCVGVIVLVVSLRNAVSPPHPIQPLPTGR
jgi:hypothetical protein